MTMKTFPDNPDFDVEPGETIRKWMLCYGTDYDTLPRMLMRSHEQLEDLISGRDRIDARTDQST